MKIYIKLPGDGSPVQAGRDRKVERGGTGMKQMTREEKRYWRRERIKAVLVVALMVIAWALIEAISGGAA